MEKTFDTVHGEVVVKTAMIDVDGTNLEEGVVITLDGKEIHSIVNGSFSQFEKMSDAMMELYVEDHLEF